MTSMNVFETDIIRELLKVHPDTLTLDLGSIVVVNREYSGVGFFTHIEKAIASKFYEGTRTDVWNSLGARLAIGEMGTTTIESGYIVYIRDGYLHLIEGFTYGDEWPERIERYSFYAI